MHRLRELDNSLRSPPTPFGLLSYKRPNGQPVLAQRGVSRWRPRTEVSRQAGDKLDVVQGREAARLSVLNAISIAGSHPRFLGKVTGVSASGIF